VNGLAFRVKNQSGEDRIRTIAPNAGENAVPGDCGAESGALDAQKAHFPPDLATVVEAWPKLPEAIRAGILAMIRAAK
jgi:hypothetical protein